MRSKAPRRSGSKAAGETRSSSWSLSRPIISRSLSASLPWTLGMDADREEIQREIDREEPMLARMFEKRLRSYRAIGYVGGDDKETSEAPNDETTVQRDEEALRHFDDPERGKP
jgi:hypothetical protein